MVAINSSTAKLYLSETDDMTVHFQSLPISGGVRDMYILSNSANGRNIVDTNGDGEKVKLQLFLDHREFRKHVVNLLGGDSELTWIGGLVKLGELTEEAEELFMRTTEKK